MDWQAIEKAFLTLCAAEGRPGVAAATAAADLLLLPEQRSFLERSLAARGLGADGATAVALAVAYHPDEVEAIPAGWTGRNPAGGRWNDYARAYHELNRCLNRIARALADRFGGVALGATIDGIAGTVSHVRDYFPRCLSHRAVAEAAGLGWRGRHGLIVTPEFGPACRLATLLLPGRLESPRRSLPDCGECSACVELCPVLRKGAALPDQDVYREDCRRRIKALALEADVCGLCVRRCWEAVRPPSPISHFRPVPHHPYR